MSKKQESYQATKNRIDKVSENEVKVLINSKKDLPELIEKAKYELTEKVVAFMDDYKLEEVSTLQIIEVMSKGVTMSRTRYSDLELAIAFEIYKELVSQLSTVDNRHVPTVQKFCMWIGISTKTYNVYKESDDPNMRDVVAKIEDYFTSVIEDYAYRGKIPFAFGISQLKAKHGYVEQVESIGTTIEINVDTNDIRSKIRQAEKSRVIDASYKEK